MFERDRLETKNGTTVCAVQLLQSVCYVFMCVCSHDIWSS